MSQTVVLFGGSSFERRVSVASAQNVAALLPGAALWFLHQDGAVYEAPREKLLAHAEPFTTDFVPGTSPRWGSLDEALASDEVAGRTFFLALHGGDGENGVIQGKLEARGHAFTGSGSKASAEAFDKARTKQLAAAAGARVAEEKSLKPRDYGSLESTLAQLLANAPRWVLKPQADGSSNGLVHLSAPADIAKAAKVLREVGLPYLAEVFIEGRELTVGVVQDGQGLSPLPVSEVRLLNGGRFDYEGKYLGRNTEELTPAPIDAGERRDAQALALLTHKAVGCYGYSRTDMILSPRGLYLLEINTLPGLTKASFIPQQLAAAGRDVKGFLLGQLELARARKASES